MHVGVRMIEEGVKHIVDGRLRQDELLKILGVERVSIHVDRRQKDGFHLVKTKFVRWLVRSDKNLNEKKAL